jgi:glucose-6-phosphate 1-dehydrogenase
MASPDQVIIFGASGDLTRRKLIPALARLDSDPRPPVGFSIMGVSRSDKTDEQFRMELAGAIPADLRGAFDKIPATPNRSLRWARSSICCPEVEGQVGSSISL